MKLEILLQAMKADAHECNKRLNAVLRNGDGRSVSAGFCTNCGAPVARHDRATCSAACAAARKAHTRSSYRRTKEWNE